MLGVAVTVIVVILPWRGAEDELPVADVPGAGEDDSDAVIGEFGVDDEGPLPVADVPILIVLFSVVATVLVRISVEVEWPLAHGIDELPDAVTGGVPEELEGDASLVDDDTRLALLTVTVRVNGTVTTDVTFVVCSDGGGVPLPMLEELLASGTPVPEL